MEGSSRRLLLTFLRVYTVVIFPQAELRTRMRATLDGTELQDLGKPLYTDTQTDYRMPRGSAHRGIMTKYCMPRDSAH